MASRCPDSPDVGIFESQPAKPQPLRIIKRSQTITGSSTSNQSFGEATRRGSGSSTQSFNESFNVGSPPFGADRPLTVHKLRKKRASVLDGVVDSSSPNIMCDLTNKSSQSQFATQDDPDLTPKAAKPVHRTFSAGAFLHSEFHRGSSEAPDYQFQIPKIPDRRRIKSKNFFLRAIGGRGSTRDKPSPEHIDTGDASTRPVSNRSTTSATSYEGSTLNAIIHSALVLYPEITITPEVQSMESESCTLWVGVSIAAKLSRADGELGYERNPPSLDINRGRLHSMRIELFAGENCQIREIVGNLHELKAVNPGETVLILAKVRLGRISLPFSAGSEDLIADLESQLGNSITHYLKVRISYNHSGFKDTILQTVATGSIKRHNAHSTWVVAQPENSRMPSNPVIVLIESHFSVNKARQAIRKLAEDRILIPLAMRSSNANRRGIKIQEDIVETVNVSHPRFDSSADEDPICSNSIPVPQKYETFSSLPGNMPELNEEMDPARKIWTEMRRTSRGHHHRSSVSASNYEPLDIHFDHIENVSPWMTNSDVEYERSHIRHLALRNKRSVGQDTLRSMAPSTKKGNVGALGLGRNWGWPAWW